MSSKQAYLAAHYMSGPKADAILARDSSKKKKRKATSSAATSKPGFIVDTDGGWGDEMREEAEEVEDVIIASDRTFKKRKVDGGSGWTTVKEPTPPPAEDEKPQIVVEEEPAPMLGGLVSAKQLRKALPQSNVEAAATADEIALAQETIYRDARGKKIDTKAARAEAARLKREREEKEAQKMEWGKGLVQRDEAEKLKQQLEKNRTSKFARHADDADLNEEQKAKELWNDPAAQFLTKKRAKGPRRPEYSGPTPAPNRFGIKPGYRWDGVDRGNGFEKKMFQRLNEKKRQGAQTYQWSAEDM